MNCKFFITLIFGSILTLSLAQNGLAQNAIHTPLLEDNEFVLLSFAIENSPKIITVATARDNSYIVYRFGEENNIELEYPEKTEDSWDQFTFSHHSRAVGNANALLDLNYLEFTIGDSKYFVYDSFSEEFIKSFIGRTITDINTGTQSNLQATSEAKIGNLSRLLLSPEVKSQSALKVQVPSTPGRTIEVVGVSENSVALEALEQDLQTIETEITNYGNSAQQSLSRVENAFVQLKANTLNVQTNIAYWTVENEIELETVKARAQTIASNQQAVNELVTQFQLANALESKTEYLADIIAYGERIKELGSGLELLENTAISGFNNSQTIYLNRLQNNSNNSQGNETDDQQDNT